MVTLTTLLLALELATPQCAGAGARRCAPAAAAGRGTMLGAAGAAFAAALFSANVVISFGLVSDEHPLDATDTAIPRSKRTESFTRETTRAPYHS
jgi:hypothetical protein